MQDDEIDEDLRQAIAKAAETVDKTGDPYRVIDHVARTIENETDYNIKKENLEHCRDY